MNRPVMVGVDGSPSSLVAAEHAARAAAQRSAPLRLVHGYLHPLGYGVPLNPYDVGIPAPSESAQQMLTETATDLTGRWPGLEVDVQQVAGGPGATLVEQSQRADLVVVGSRGLGGFAGLLLGSVGTQVAAHAHCPVLVVRPPDEPISVEGPVLVGVDGSAAADLAVSYAADEAARRSATLVLTQVSSPDANDASLAAAAADSPLAATAASVRAAHPDLVVEERVLSATAAEEALIEASGDVALVVVGSRGRGGFTGLLLGSVSQALVHHARCPVLVVRPHHQA